MTDTMSYWNPETNRPYETVSHRIGIHLGTGGSGVTEVDVTWNHYEKLEYALGMYVGDLTMMTGREAIHIINKGIERLRPLVEKEHPKMTFEKTVTVCRCESIAFSTESGSRSISGQNCTPAIENLPSNRA